MKKSIIVLAAIAFTTFTACDNAADQIEEENVETTTNTSEPNNNAGDINAETVSQSNVPEFTFEKENHDFGSIKEGEVAKYDFKFTNTGDAPLIISNASGSCGCTVPEWPKEPIAPGETGVIHVEFDSKGRPGSANKQVTIDANTVPNTKILTIKAQVTPQAGSANATGSQG